MSSIVEGKPQFDQSEDGTSATKAQLNEERVVVTDEDVSKALTTR